MKEKARSQNLGWRTLAELDLALAGLDLDLDLALAGSRSPTGSGCATPGSAEAQEALSPDFSIVLGSDREHSMKMVLKKSKSFKKI